LRLGVLGVLLIMVPDSSPRASKGVLILAWRLLSHFFARGPTFLGCVSFRWVRFVMLQPVWLFPHANWP
jgi:hypothetical protein